MLLHAPRPLARLLVTASVALALTVTGALGGSAAQAQKIRADFWGMHDNDWTSAPSVPVGAANLTTSVTYWRNLEKSAGVYDWSRLHAQVDAAQAVGAKPMVVLGGTPAFHSSKTGTTSAADMPIGQAWIDYVTALATEFGSVLDYQIWPEPNIVQNWNGTPKQMAWLTAAASRVIREHAPGAKVVSPAMAVRLKSQRAWMAKFFQQSIGGKRVHAYVDAIAIDPFPAQKAPPEEAYRLMAASRKLLAGQGVRKPIWNNEINYGVAGGGDTTSIRYSAAVQQSFVIRTYALSAAARMHRTYWLGWFATNTMAVRMADADGNGLAPAKSYAAVHRWLNGTRFVGCKTLRSGLWVCTAKKSRRDVRRIYWKPRGKVAIRTPRGTRRVENQSGRLVTKRSRVTLKVNYRPVMVSSRR